MFGPHPVQRQMLLLFSHRLHLVVHAVVFCPRTAASVCLTGIEESFTHVEPAPRPGLSDAAALSQRIPQILNTANIHVGSSSLGRVCLKVMACMCVMLKENHEVHTENEQLMYCRDFITSTYF